MNLSLQCLQWTFENIVKCLVNMYTHPCTVWKKKLEKIFSYIQCISEHMDGHTVPL